MTNKPNKSILILDPAGNLWGSEKVLLDFLNSNLAQNAEIGLCCPPNTPLAQAAIKLDIIVYPYFKSNLHNKGKFSRFIAAIGLAIASMLHKADVIYVNQAGATKIGLYVGRLLKIPLVPHVRLLEDVQYIEKLNSSVTDMPFVIVISKFIENAFTDIDIKSRVRIIYDAYEPQYHLSRSQITIKRASICCTGRLVPIKGQDVLIGALSVLHNRKLMATLDFYGEGLQGKNYESDLIRLVNKSRLDTHIKFKGYINNIPSKIGSYSTMVCPSHIEPLGRVIFEAWDAGIIPIAGKFSGGAEEVITASGGGLLYSEQTPEAMADILQDCMGMSLKKRAEIIENGRVWLRNNCAPDIYSYKLMEILEEACSC